jgi:hypothetical protein
MLIFILLVLFPAPQVSKVDLITGVPGAEFYLDSNFVAITDGNGNLTMESLPEGTFNLAIKKQGYSPYSGSFTIHEGEAKVLQPVLQKLEQPQDSEARNSATPYSSRPSVEKSSIADRSRNPAGDPSPLLAVSFPTAKSAGKRPTVQTSEEEPHGSSLLPLLAALFAAAFLALGFWILRELIRPLEAAADLEDPQSSVSSPSRPLPQFLEELKRREELLKAGFVSSRFPDPDVQSMKEKEVVIVLPKEAFRYEEDK